VVFLKKGDVGCLLKSGQTVYVAVQHDENYREYPQQKDFFGALQQKIRTKTLVQPTVALSACGRKDRAVFAVMAMGSHSFKRFRV